MSIDVFKLPADCPDSIDLPLSNDSRDYNQGHTAECYAVAVAVAADLRHDYPDLKIVHGVVSGPDGKRFLHAWVEIEVSIGPASLPLAIDASNPERPTTVLPAELYYFIGKVNRELCAAYSLVKIRQLCLRRLHCGPYVPPREPCLDWDEANRCWARWDGKPNA